MNLFRKNYNRGEAKKLESELDFDKLPDHIAIIMDGNGRWAKKRNLPRNMGHKAGVETAKEIALYCNEIGIKHLTVYAFSTENWSRPKDEVNGIMKLLNEYLDRFEKEFGQKDIRIRHIGELSGLPDDIQEKIKAVQDRTKENKGLSFNVALNYGGRLEIINAVKHIVQEVNKEEIREEDIDEKLFSKYMFTKDIPDPDLIIRTSGECRLSNFLLWQSVYSEFWFDEVLWPDFNKMNLNKALLEFQKRKRTYGGI